MIYMGRNNSLSSAAFSGSLFTVYPTTRDMGDPNTNYGTALLPCMAVDNPRSCMHVHMTTS